MMKKLSLLLCFALVLTSVTACGGSDGAKETKTGETKKAEETKSEEKFDADLEGRYFSLKFPENWSYDEENADLGEEGGFASVEMHPNEAAKDVTYVKVSTGNQESYHFRRELGALELTLEDFANAKYDKLEIDGLTFACGEDVYQGGYKAIYRHSPDNMTVTIRSDGAFDNEEVKAVLSGIKFTLEDNGKVDPPWPWDGERLTPTVKTEMAGTFTIVPERIETDEPIVIGDIMVHQIAKIQGDTIYHLDGNKLNKYTLNGNKLQFVSTTELEDDYEYMCSDQTGMLYLSKGVGAIDVYKDDAKYMQTGVKGDLVMHPSGSWGMTFWVSSDMQKVTNNGTTLAAEPWLCTNLSDASLRQGPFSMISDVAITDTHIMVAGKEAGTEGREKIGIFDHNGTQLMMLGGNAFDAPDALGSTTAMLETANGFAAFDGNMRKLNLWDPNGTHIGAIDVKELFGTSYPWIEDIALLDDGSVLVAVSQERDDRSANELVFFRLTGF